MRARYLVAAAGLAAVVAAAIAAAGCHGHRVRAPLVRNHAGDFDFSRPPCDPAPRPAAGPDDVLVRYLGASGVWIEWRGVAVLSAPYFSNPGMRRAAFGRAGRDEAAIERGLAGLPLERVRIVLAGHAHYDHVGDLPSILPRLDPRTAVLVNRSGQRLLEGCCGAGRLIDVELPRDDDPWIRFRHDGASLPLRVLPLPSGHAPHLSFFHYGKGEVAERWSEEDWTRRRFRAMKEGRTHAFLIDLLAEDLETVRFRIHLQDAVSEPPLGFPGEPVIADGGPVDLAVLCMPSFWLVESYPEGILRRSRARHALVTHYEDFFRPTDRPLRFVPLLTDRRANEFLGRLDREMKRDYHRPAGPDPCCCGPCGESWTMPLPGEWIRFRSRAAGAS